MHSAHFMFDNNFFQLIYEKAYALCCSIGMNLLTLETDAEVQCLTKLNDSELKIFDYISILKVI